MDIPKQQDLAHQHVCELTDGGGDHLIVQGAQGADSDHLHCAPSLAILIVN